MKLNRLIFAAAFALLAFPAVVPAQENTPRSEYPRPQFVREDWINLNGTWSYEFDFSHSGMDRRTGSVVSFQGWSGSICAIYSQAPWSTGWN